MTPNQQRALLPLALLAVISAWWLWSLSREEPVEVLTGPPRSDYSLEDFRLVAMDELGKESFSVTGPRLSRHPFLGTLDIDTPQFAFPDAKGQRWSARAGHAWVAADGDELRLYDNYRIDGPPATTMASAAATPAMHMQGPDIRFFPDTHVAKTDSEVTIRNGGSILRGHGMQVDLDTRRVELSQLQGHFPVASREPR